MPHKYVYSYRNNCASFRNKGIAPSKKEQIFAFKEQRRNIFARGTGTTPTIPGLREYVVPTVKECLDYTNYSSRKHIRLAICQKWPRLTFLPINMAWIRVSSLNSILKGLREEPLTASNFSVTRFEEEAPLLNYVLFNWTTFSRSRIGEAVPLKS
jgi:hypothetical protein